MSLYFIGRIDKLLNIYFQKETHTHTTSITIYGDSVMSHHNRENYRVHMF